MRSAFLIHKGGLQNSQVMPAKTVLSMGTSWGVDMIGIHLDFDTPLTAENVLDQVVTHRSASDVALTIVNGEVLMKDREVLTLDEEKVRHEAALQAKRLWEVSKVGQPENTALWA